MQDLNRIKLEDLKVGDILSAKRLRNAYEFTWRITKGGNPLQFIWVSDSSYGDLLSCKIYSTLSQDSLDRLQRGYEVSTFTKNEVFSL